MNRNWDPPYGMGEGMRVGTLTARNNIFAFTEPGQAAFGAVTELDESHNLLLEGAASPDIGAYELR